MHYYILFYKLYYKIINFIVGNFISLKYMNRNAFKQNISVFDLKK